ncbi:hypothetical protein H6G94_15220 [Nostoc punctiforme FACHB-252]|jgi:hypothetical protein|uniref:Uncharacterized protein n=1 Tax=Nostoc punctiforme FACHB-252 TaxID=1357509 RepID=A0ABR8HAZ9_NOSPU|nr:hypothetical protein [Nostoc punctiforme]MBD2612608.1 hypothetical protein [Nostoc punctiforme FACHB-252]
MPIAKLVMSEEEQGLVSQKVKVKRKKLRIKFQDLISSLLPFALWLTPRCANG